MNEQNLQWEFHWDNNTGDSRGTVGVVFHFLVWIHWTLGWPYCCGQLWLCGGIILFQAIVLCIIQPTETLDGK